MAGSGGAPRRRWAIELGSDFRLSTGLEASQACSHGLLLELVSLLSEGMARETRESGRLPAPILRC